MTRIPRGEAQGPKAFARYLRRLFAGPKVIDDWMQHPTAAFVGHDMFASLRRWMGAYAG